MSPVRQWALLAATGLLAGGCQILSYTWAVPAAVAPGRVFTMRVVGQTDNAAGAVGAVFQVPNGFTVLGASHFASASFIDPLDRDEPALLSLYAPDPGHHLASFSSTSGGGGAGTIAVDLKVYVQAPPTPGVYQLEMALAATTGFGTGFVPQLGLTSFQAPGGSVVRSLQISATPAPPPFALGSVFLGPPSVGSNVIEVEAGDVDRDGRDDLVVLTGTSITLRRSIPGGFAPGIVWSHPGASLFDCALGDFDGDGFRDIAVSDGTVLFGGAGGTWTPVVAFAGTGTAFFVAAGDVDGDGLDDLARSDGPSLGVLRGQANRTFVPWNTGLTLPVPTTSPARILVVDLDGDGRAELVLAPPGPTPVVYRSTAAGVWSVVGTLPPSSRVVALDVDGNGTLELLLASTGQLFSCAASGLSPAPSIGVSAFTVAAPLDFDRDGRVDLALGRSGLTGGFELWRNPGAGTFVATPLPPGTGFEVLEEFGALQAADFDDDTFPDLCANIDEVLVWHNTQQGVAPFGEPCAAPASLPPDLSVAGSVAPGQSGVLQLANAGPQGAALLWLGHSKTTWNGLPVLPLDLGIVGAPGCTLLAEPLVIVGAIANGAGVASLPFTVPPFAPTAEATVFVQGAILAPAANPLGLVFSRGLALKIQ